MMCQIQILGLNLDLHGSKMFVVIIMAEYSISNKTFTIALSELEILDEG